jgi:hypothetical protein
MDAAGAADAAPGPAETDRRRRRIRGHRRASGLPFFGLVVRTPLAAEQIERSIRQPAAGVDAGVPISAVRPLDELADATRAWRRASMVLATVGVEIGIALAAALARALGTLLFGVGPVDPLTFAGVGVLTCLSALAASAPPALPAARVDPTVTLRLE